MIRRHPIYVLAEPDRHDGYSLGFFDRASAICASNFRLSCLAVCEYKGRNGTDGPASGGGGGVPGCSPPVDGPASAMFALSGAEDLEKPSPIID